MLIDCRATQGWKRLTPPKSSRVLSCPSRSIVARICSEPGVTVKSDLALMPWSIASCAIDAARDISSYEEFVQEPIRPTLSSSGHLFSTTASLNLEIGVARSGSEGAIDVWLKLGKIDLDELIVLRAFVFLQIVGIRFCEFPDGFSLGSFQISRHVLVEWEDGGGGANLGTHVCHVVSVCVIWKRFKNLLQMVPMPVQERESTPGPSKLHVSRYSTKGFSVQE